jgi:acetyltransferase-like isoleucine patch superfamily enzyme
MSNDRDDPNDQGGGTPRNPPPRNAVDRFIRRFNAFSHVAATLALYGLAATALGLALTPTLWAGYGLWKIATSLPDWQRWLVLGLAAGGGFFAFGFALMIVVALFNFLLPTRVGPFHGSYYTLAAVPWYLHNGLFYLVRYTFLPFVTFTPFGIWFLRAMGMKIGRGTLINSENLSDPRLLTLGDNVAVGGNVRIFAHYGGGGHLTIAPVVIGDGVTLGLGCTVMGNVQIELGATILPHSVLLPGSRVGAHEVWGGVPARPISREDFEHFKEGIQGVKTPAPPYTAG